MIRFAPTVRRAIYILLLTAWWGCAWTPRLVGSGVAPDVRLALEDPEPAPNPEKTRPNPSLRTGELRQHIPSDDGEVKVWTEYRSPYRPVRIMSSYRDRRGGGRHQAIDFAGVGRNHGLGMPIRAIGRSRVVMIGRGEQDPHAFGRPLTGTGMTVRNGYRLPRSMVVPGYGRVYFFTRTYGRWRSGNVLITELLEGPLQGYTVRYMHLGAVHPDLAVGDVIDRGQEIGLMGGTAVQTDLPHLHLDAETRHGRRVDLGPYLGIYNRRQGEDGPAACERAGVSQAKAASDKREAK